MGKISVVYTPTGAQEKCVAGMYALLGALRFSKSKRAVPLVTGSHDTLAVDNENAVAQLESPVSVGRFSRHQGPHIDPRLLQAGVLQNTTKNSTINFQFTKLECLVALCRALLFAQLIEENG